MKQFTLNKIAVCFVAGFGVVLLLLLTFTAASIVKADSSPRHLAIPTITGTPPTPLISLSYNRPVTSPSVSCDPDEGPEKAVNGTWIYGAGDNWCTSSATKRIQIDLGQNYYISYLKVIHAGGATNGGPSKYNTRDFSIYGIKQTSSPYSQLQTIVSVTGANFGAQSWSFPVGQQVIARHIWLVVKTGAQPGEANIARIYDIIVNGTPAP